MAEACLGLAEGPVSIAVCVDEDDPQREAYADLCREYRLIWHCGPRQGLTGWTNTVAVPAARSYRALASFGDDHLCRTPGWDALLLAAIDDMGGTGIAYGDDLIMGADLPTAPVVSSDIVGALGWMLEPSLAHMCVDMVLHTIGSRAGCLAYVPGVVTEHMHWGRSKSRFDAVYAAAEAVKEADRERYAVWLRDRMAGDVAAVRALRREAPGG